MGSTSSQHAIDWAAVASGLAVAALFISGALFGDIYEARMSATKTRSSAAAIVAATIFSSNAKEPSPRMNTIVKLVETLGPAVIGTIGTIITAILSFYFTRMGGHRLFWEVFHQLASYGVGRHLY